MRRVRIRTDTKDDRNNRSLRGNRQIESNEQESKQKDEREIERLRKGSENRVLGRNVCLAPLVAGLTLKEGSLRKGELPHGGKGQHENEDGAVEKHWRR